MAGGAARGMSGSIPVWLGDDLLSQPLSQAVLDVGGHFLFVCKPKSHKAIEEFRVGIAPGTDRPGPEWQKMARPPLSMARRRAVAR